MKRLLRALALLLALAVAGIATTTAAMLWVVASPARVQQLVDWSLRDSGVDVRFSGARLHKGPLPWTWRLQLDGLAVVPEDPAAPRLSLDRARFRIPGVVGLAAGRIHLGHVELDGLHIEIPTRRASSGGGSGAGPVITAASVAIRGASVHAPADDPLPALDIRGLEAELRRFALRVGSGPLRGQGWLAADSYRAGLVQVDDIRSDALRLHGEGLDIHALRFALAGGHGTGRVDIDKGAERPRIQVVADIQDVQLSALTRQATGSAGPVEGRLSGTITVQAGGRLPRGGARTHAEVRIEDGEVRVSERLGVGARAVLKLLPWITLRKGRLLLGPTEGSLLLRRGHVVVERLVHRHTRDLELWGEQRRGTLDLTLHLAKRSGADGAGLVVQGRPGALELRRARREELQRPE